MNQRVLCRSIAIGLGIVAFVGLYTGCAQNTEVPVVQETGQDLLSPTSTDQDAATQGSQVNVWVINAPARGSLPVTVPVDLGAEDGISNLVEQVKTAEGADIQGTDAGYAQSAITINVTTGGTTPSQAGTTTATASASQTPSAYPTVSPVQEVRPETSASVPIGIALPGGMVDQQSVATGRGQTAGTEKTSENELRWIKLEAMADRLEQLLPLLERLFEVPAEPEDAAEPEGSTTEPPAEPTGP